MKHAALPLLALTAALSACGYAPLYTPANTDQIAASHVRIGTVRMENAAMNVGTRRVAQKVSQRLREDFPEQSANADTLEVSIYETMADLAIQKNATTQRGQVELRGGVVLSAPDGKKRLETTITSKAPYNVENTPYGTESGKTYARLTAAENLAAEIGRRLALFYRTQPAPTPAPAK